jgi:hypothetical protein
MENNFDGYKEALQRTIDSELDSMETFSPEMVKHIQKVYRELREQRRQWLEAKQREKEEQP